MRSASLALRILGFVFSVATTVVFSAAACGGARGGDHGAGTTGSTWNVTAMIPADTPYVFATLSPFPEGVRKKFSAGFHAQLARASKQLEPALAGSSSPGAKAVRSLISELSTQPPEQWWQNAGFADGGRFALYGLALWPVLRVEVAHADAVDRTIRRTLTAAGITTEPRHEGAWLIWQFEFDEAAVVIAVTANEAVASAMPAQLVTRAMPWLLGTRRPERSLADDGAIPALLRQHGFLPQFVGELDLQQTLAILSGRGTGVARDLGEALRVPALAGCAGDVDRLAALTPRLAFGYLRLDEQAFSASIVAEMPPPVVAALGRLVTAAPGVTWPFAGRPLFAMAAAADLGAVISLLGDLGNAIQARPFTCPGLAELNASAQSWRALPSQVLPPIVTGLRGFSLIVDEASIDPPAGVGHLLVVSDQMDTLPTWLGLVPGLGELKLGSDGLPVALPLESLGVAWAGAAHAALRGDRLVVTVGRDSARRATEELKQLVPPRSPLFAITYDVVRFRQLSPVFAEALGGYSLREAGFAVDVSDQGLRMLVEGTW